MAASFSVVSTPPRVKWIMGDRTVTEDPEGYRTERAKEAFTKRVGREWYDRFSRSFTIMRNLFSLYGVEPDTATQRARSILSATTVLRRWLVVAQQIADVPGEIGYRVGPDGGDVLLATSDGQKHASREDCWSRALELELLELRHKLTSGTVRAVCNVSSYSEDSPDLRKQMSEFHYLNGWRRLWANDMAGPVKREAVATVCEALELAVPELLERAERLPS